MARLGPRVTASAGVLAAFLLLGGSATVALADPGGSHSDRGNSSDRGSERGESVREDGEPGGDGGRGEGEDGSADKNGFERPEVRFGSGRVEGADITKMAPTIAGPGNGGAASRSPESDVSESGELGEARPPGRSGLNRAGAPRADFSPPRVTFGNGRTPSVQKRDPEPQWRVPAVEPAPAAPSPPPPGPAPTPPPPSWADRLPAPPVLTQQMGEPRPADWSDPLWGLAGLLLIPVAGAVLGYRQARAAHEAERLHRS